ncbi:uncharacterized protein LOC125177934 [Hyalella azteca]|uniref:Uncharacterized protein LOC125177934 n=1 Tax=Hyalella azteca TaxID=294128 RepID=A0A979FI35_HYAAZ|nr:uncharacterized protein LOC125177934 [Hyalella azteca]
MKLDFLVRNVKVIIGLSACLHHVLSTILSGTYQQFALADEPRYRTVCQPVVFPLQPQLKIQNTILCYSFCIRNSSCTIFSVAGNMCSLWSFQTDPSYGAVTMLRPTVVAYWPKRTAPVTVIDIAMGKPVSVGSTSGGFGPGIMMTAGTTCYQTWKDCFCSGGSDNWAVVDLQAEVPIRKVVITGPTLGLVSYFENVTLRAGVTGQTTDPFIGQTLSTPATMSYPTYTFAIADGNVRYLRLQNEVASFGICACKVQAFL